MVVAFQRLSSSCFYTPAEFSSPLQLRQKILSKIQEIDSFLNPAGHLWLCSLPCIWCLPLLFCGVQTISTQPCFMSLTWEVLLAKESYSWTVLPKVKQGAFWNKGFEGNLKSKMRTSSSLPKSSRWEYLLIQGFRLIPEGWWFEVNIHESKLAIFRPKKFVKVRKQSQHSPRKASLFRPATKTQDVAFCLRHVRDFFW